jgi:starvation-inducible DNA-binding protein
MSLPVVLARALADTFMMATHAHIAHWNLLGSDFVPIHAYLGDLYDDLAGAVDGLAERIRVCGPAAPLTLSDLVARATIPDTNPGNRWIAIRGNLERENATIITSLNEAFLAATEAGNQGVADYVASRLDAHAKHGWFLAVSR